MTDENEVKALANRLYDAAVSSAGSPSISVWETAQHAAREALRWRDETRPQQPAAAVPEGGLRDSVLNSAKFRASCYALVGIVEGIQGLGRCWAANGERLKDTREWVAFYNCVASMRNGTFNQASAEQAQQPAVAVPATAAECDFIGSFLDLFEDSEPNALIAKRALAKIKAALAQQPAALAVLQDLSERFSAMHANGDVWITSVAAAKMAQAAAAQTGMRDAR